MTSLSTSTRTRYPIEGTIRKSAGGAWYPEGAANFPEAATRGYRGIGTIEATSRELRVNIQATYASDRPRRACGPAGR